MKRLTLAALPLCLAFPASGRTDTLELENGDRVSGTILELDGGRLEIEADLFGAVTAEWGAVRELRTDAPVYVTLTDDRDLTGTLEVAGESAAVITSDAVRVELTRAEIAAIRSEVRQAAFLEAVAEGGAPVPDASWASAVDGSLSLTSGNAATRSLHLGIQAARTRGRDRMRFYLTSLFANNSTGGATLTTANAVRGGGRYEIDISDRVFTFGFSDLEFDRFQGLDLRLVIGGGAGLNLFETSTNTFRVFGGGSSNQEFFASGFRRRSAESVVGEEWNYRPNDVTSFTERLAVYPNLNDAGEYRVNFDSTALARLNDWLSWQVTLSHRYTSRPLPGKRPNDLLFTTGIRITLGDGNLGAIGPGNIDFQ